jgi:hypothetical protein
MPLVDVPAGRSAHLLRVRTLRALEDARLLRFQHSTPTPHVYTVTAGDEEHHLAGVEVLPYAALTALAHARVVSFTLTDRDGNERGPAQPPPRGGGFAVSNGRVVRQLDAEEALPYAVALADQLEGAGGRTIDLFLDVKPHQWTEH